MIPVLHKAAGLLATLTIACFWLATALSEAFLDRAAVVWVKSAVPWGFLVLIPAIALAGATGIRLAAGRDGGAVGRKRRRMPRIAANGIVVLVPSALFLAARAGAGSFDAAFYAVQGLELLAGGANLLLMALNIRDGRRMTAARRRRAAGRA